MTRRARRGLTVPGLAGVRGRVRRIVTLDGPGGTVLRSRSRRVSMVDAAIRRLIADMLVTMRRAQGVGLAAVQIGVPLRVLVADAGAGPVALVNPRLRARRGTQVGREGCLSIPGAYGIVRRAREVRVEGRNARGRHIVVRGRDLLARVLQHEIDHLNGVLFLDRIAAQRHQRVRLGATRGDRRIRPAALANPAAAAPRSRGRVPAARQRGALPALLRRSPGKAGPS